MNGEAWCASLSFTISQSWLKLVSIALVSIALVMPSIHLILCYPLLLLPSILPNELALCIRGPKCFGASASASVLSMNIQD